MASLTPAHIEDHLDWVRPALTALYARLPRAEDETEGVIADCIEGRAGFFLGEEEGALVVLCDSKSERGEPVLWVHAAIARGAGNVDRYLPAIEFIARDRGATEIRMSSPRKGWLRNPHWRVHDIVFYRPVQGVNHGWQPEDPRGN